MRMLMIILNLVGCSTGRSAGRGPLEDSVDIARSDGAIVRADRAVGDELAPIER